MDSWESDIRKKALAARPFEAQANWGKMEAMLEEPVAAKKALFLRGKQYWLIAAALLMLFGATSALTVWQAPETDWASEQAIANYASDNVSAEDSEPEVQTQDLMAAVAEESLPSNSRYQYRAGQNKGSASKIQAVAARQFDDESVPSLDPGAEDLYLAFANSDQAQNYHINPLPTPYTARTGAKLSVSSQVVQYQPEIKNRRVVKDLRVGLYLTQDNVRKQYEFADEVYANIVHIHAGFGLGLMKRIRRVWEAGIRLELSEMYYYVASSDQSYSDLVGNEWRAKLNLRRYLRKDVSKKIQPYVGLSSGISKASLDLYQIQFVEVPEPNDEPIARKSSDNPILPDGYVQYFSELNQLPSYEISTAHDVNQYLRWENSLQLGTDIRLRPRLSLNFELGAKVASMIGGRVMVLDVIDNHTFQMQQNIGLQYAF
ncbi:MAG: hypothetical protein AAF927_27880 [Bacteroidota bacterium]